MRNDYKIRPRQELKKGGGIAMKKGFLILNKDGMADMITAKMSKEEKR
jgi:hypothetical protein